MTTQDGPRVRRAQRHRAGSICGYIGFVFGLLCVLSVASEFDEPLPVNEAAMTVFLTMIVGYAAGWLIQPLLAIVFPQW
ncbi:MAG TPA: hypothetical protein VGR43_05075 [Dehalococcoidia bacterium]|jgi:hypothetical protein|nr:hypothetical protein [Dehalococcoidia bacterium]